MIWYIMLSDTAEKAEGGLMLHRINELREHQSHSAGEGMATKPIYHTLALLHTVLGEQDKVCTHVSVFKSVELSAYPTST